MPPPDDRTRPHKAGTGSGSGLVGSNQSISRNPDTLEQFARRVILDALQESSASWWEHRAVTFDRVGNQRCDETAELCRIHASILRQTGIPDAAEDLAAALGEFGWEAAA